MQIKKILQLQIIRNRTVVNNKQSDYINKKALHRICKAFSVFIIFSFYFRKGGLATSALRSFSRILI